MNAHRVSVLYSTYSTPDSYLKAPESNAFRKGKYLKFIYAESLRVSLDAKFRRAKYLYVVKISKINYGVPRKFKTLRFRFMHTESF